jgi:hypothetical protein
VYELGEKSGFETLLVYLYKCGVILLDLFGVLLKYISIVGCRLGLFKLLDLLFCDNGFLKG